MKTSETTCPDSSAPASSLPADAAEGELLRVSRLLRIVQEIRRDPHQPLDALWSRFNISRSQFYKDKKALKQIGFTFEYCKQSGFRILEDRLAPITGLSLSDRLVLMFALEHLSASGDGALAVQAVNVGRKLAMGLESPFREQLQACFDRQVTSTGFGVRQEILDFLGEAVTEGRRIKILYERSADWSKRWRTVDPRHLYMRQRTLYLYARTVDETPFCWKVFRVSRIHEVENTGISLAWDEKTDDGFLQQQANAFMAFFGPNTRTVRMRFTGQARRFVLEQQWHESQELEEQSDGSLLFTVRVAEPLEVVRWARQFADEAQVLEIEDPEED